MSLDEYDYGIFIFQPNDISIIRREPFNAVRDNVIFELGLYFGKLGRDRAFYLVPENHPKVHIPTDLAGITAGTYDYERLINDRLNLRAIVGPFCTQIKGIITQNVKIRPGIGIKRAELFNNFTEEFEKMILNTKKITLFFIHSRQWRENNHNSIVRFLHKEGTKMIVLLPNFLNPSLMDRIKSNFSDGEVIATLVRDAFNYFLELNFEFNKIEIRLYDFYPTYSFYCFDEEAIVALYPTTAKKKNVPSFRISKDSKFWHFLEDDINELIKVSKKITKQFINKLKK